MNSEEKTLERNKFLKFLHDRDKISRPKRLKILQDYADSQTKENKENKKNKGKIVKASKSSTRWPEISIQIPINIREEAIQKFKSIVKEAPMCKIRFVSKSRFGGDLLLSPLKDKSKPDAKNADGKNIGKYRYISNLANGSKFGLKIDLSKEKNVLVSLEIQATPSVLRTSAISSSGDLTYRNEWSRERINNKKAEKKNPKKEEYL